ncbi:Major facilitator superfamily domain general substrate transporter [Penicillium taxi]|uniref:Major facilitator superfamily domain general substrate transporter n=1 Tax=Penicillium taxi TaxID=168475 RepID=UPI0025453271|nr:Major facilitator superfamily domain general substrate transporter [Penicillium taxi]KAJ5885384.1 Major facilitator superfamily domain general substrate transporter [Penicillium taxi]
MIECSRSQSSSTIHTDVDHNPRAMSRPRSFTESIKRSSMNQNTEPEYPSGNVINQSEKEEHTEGSSIEESIVKHRINKDMDLERGAKPESEDANRKTSTSDVKLVTWDGPDDSKNPKNWTLQQKWTAAIIMSFFTLISPISSSMVAPALEKMASDLEIHSDITLQLSLSVFVLAYAIGPLVLGPLSEIYGRLVVLQLANLFFLVFNIGCATSQTKVQMIICRFFSGLGGSAPMPEERGKSVAIYSLAPLLGPAVGPIAGAFIAEKTSWRWVFWSTSILDAVIAIVGIFFLRETYAPKILLNRARTLRKETGDNSYETEVEIQNKSKSLGQRLGDAFVRPFRLLFTQPIIIVLALYMAFVYGIMYLVLSTFPRLWTNPSYYNESVGIGGLNYISLGVGFFFGSQTCAPLNDRIYRTLKARNAGVGNPEMRVPLMIVASVFVPAGLFIYGWTAEKHAHWIAPNIGTALFGIGVIMAFQCIQTYLVDAYTRYAASALAAASVLRSLAGFCFPLFAPYMYDSLRFGWGNSVLAFISIAVGVPAPLFLWRYGPVLRQKSPFAAG